MTAASPTGTQDRQAAMETIRGVFPALGIAPSNNFDQDYKTAQVRIAALMGLQGDPATLKDQIAQKMNEFAAGPKYEALSRVKNSPVLLSAGLKAAEGYENFPPPIKENPPLIFPIIDNRAKIIDAMNVIASTPAPVTTANATVSAAQTVAPVNNTAVVAPAVPVSSPVGTTQMALDKPAVENVLKEFAALAEIAGVPLPPDFDFKTDYTPEIGNAILEATKGMNSGQAADILKAQGANSEQLAGNFTFINNTLKDAEANIQLLNSMKEQNIDPIAFLSTPTPAGPEVVNASTSSTPVSDVQSAPQGAEKPAVDIAKASAGVKELLAAVGSKLGGMGDMVGFKTPSEDEIKNGEFTDENAKSLSIALIALRKLGGEANPNGAYVPAQHNSMVNDLLTKPEYASILKQITDEKLGALTFEDDKQKKAAQKELLDILFNDLDALANKNKLNTERAKNDTFYNLMLDKVAEFLPPGIKNFIKGLFEDPKFGPMLSGVAGMFGVQVGRLWGEKPVGAEELLTRSGPLVQKGFEGALALTHPAEGKTKIEALQEQAIGKIDSPWIKTLTNQLFEGADQDVLKNALNSAFEKAKSASENEASAAFSAEIIAQAKAFKEGTNHPSVDVGTAVSKAKTAIDATVKDTPANPEPVAPGLNSSATPSPAAAPVGDSPDVVSPSTSSTVVAGAGGGGLQTLDGIPNVIKMNDGEGYQMILESRTQFVQGPLRYSNGRVEAMQGVLERNWDKLGLTLMEPSEMHRNGTQKFTDRATPNMNAIIEELLIRAQFHAAEKAGTPFTDSKSIQHKISAENIPVILGYLRDKGVPEADIKKFGDNAQSMAHDMRSWGPNGHVNRAPEKISVAEQSFYPQIKLDALNVELKPQPKVEPPPVSIVVEPVKPAQPPEATITVVPPAPVIMEVQRPPEPPPQVVVFDAPPPPKTEGCPADTDFVNDAGVCVNHEIGDSGDRPDVSRGKLLPVAIIESAGCGLGSMFNYYGWCGDTDFVKQNAGDAGADSHYDPDADSVGGMNYSNRHSLNQGHVRY